MHDVENLTTYWKTFRGGMSFGITPNSNRPFVFLRDKLSAVSRRSREPFPTLISYGFKRNLNMAVFMSCLLFTLISYCL